MYTIVHVHSFSTSAIVNVIMLLIDWFIRIEVRSSVVGGLGVGELGGPKTKFCRGALNLKLRHCSGVFPVLISSLANLSFSQVIRPISAPSQTWIIFPRSWRDFFFLAYFPTSNFNSSQSAYIPHHSTETALTVTLDNVFHAADTGSATFLVSLDLSAAFDSINHNILINRLSSCFGLTGLALD